MEAKAVDLRNWIIHFGYELEELRVVVAKLNGWMDNYYPPPWAEYQVLMACRMLALDKSPGVSPVEIGETLCQVLAKIFMREAGGQAKTACGNLQL